ncbi:MAG TPA: hypothetical protein VFR09_00245 [Alphaproteobacteria bacterium]|nr:hypothetical protein [Alphaproteobacteria bacterium]
MRFVAAFFVFAFLASGSAQAADQWQAREVARLNNCPPKKIEVYSQTLGTDGKTIYRVDCNMPKGKGDDSSAGPKADALLVSCDETLCELLRPLAPESK